MTSRRWLRSCEELQSKNQGCGVQASSDSGATITSTPAVTKGTPLSLRSPHGDASWLFYTEAAFEGRDVLLANLGKHRTGKVCVYIRRLADVDLKVVETLVAKSAAETKRRYPQRDESDA